MKLQKHVLCFWMLAALLPFALVRTYVYCNSSCIPTNFTSLILNAPHDKPAPVWVTSSSSSLLMDHHQDRISSKNKTDQLVATHQDGIIIIKDKDTKADTVESKHDSNANYSTTDSGISNTNKEVEHTESITEIAAIDAKAPNLGDIGSCDLSNGSWVPDSRDPQYTNDTCKFIQAHQDCMTNGRPDRNYLHWRWKPNDCELPRIDGRATLDSMRGKSMVFVGDSIARNQFQALLCTLSQTENPSNIYRRDDDKENTYLFPSYNFTLSIRWSPYLIRQSDKEIVMGDNMTQVVAHLDLDVLEESWVNAIIGADVVVMSSGHWWLKSAVFLEEGEAVGSHNLGRLQTSKNMGFEEVYRTAWHNVLKGVGLIAGYKGVTLLRSFAPEHFENGRWDTGGSCPHTDPSNEPLNSLNKLMYTMQFEEFQSVSKEISSTEAAARLKLVDITNLSQGRMDGHPNAFRMYQPFAKDFQGPIQHDCLHWCLPGPIDVWNDMLVQSMNQLKSS